MIIKNIQAAIAIGTLSFTTVSHSLEGPSPAGPIGGTDLNQAVLPPPGVYLGVVGGMVNFDKVVPKHGKSLSADGGIDLQAVGAMIVYPVQLFGGSLASTIGAGRQGVCLGVAGGDEECSRGMADTYTDLLVWSKFSPKGTEEASYRYGTDYMVALGVTWPTGEYDKSKAINAGSHFYTVSPSFAITHTRPSLLGEGFGQATQFSARFFYNYYFENRATDYDTGDTVSVDFSVAQVAGPWTYGFTGTGYSQVVNDKVSGHSNGVDSNSLNLGAVAQYNFSAGRRPAFVKLKFLQTVEGQNALFNKAFAISAGLKY